MEEKKNTVLFSENEKVIAELGQNYLDSFLTGGGFSKTVMVLTDKRIYIKGKRFIGTGRVNTSADFNINDVTGTVYAVRSPMFLRLIILLLMVGGLVAAVLTEAPVSSLPILLLFLIILLLIRDTRALGIIVHGTEFSFPVQRYKNDVIGSFRQAVALMVESHRDK
jgi:hypothetical protein